MRPLRMAEVPSCTVPACVRLARGTAMAPAGVSAMAVCPLSRMRSASSRTSPAEAALARRLLTHDLVATSSGAGYCPMGSGASPERRMMSLRMVVLRVSLSRSLPSCCHANSATADRVAPAWLLAAPTFCLL